MASREHFIPVRKADLIQALASDVALDPPDRENLQQLCRMLAARIHYDYHEDLENLKDSYAQFDPDADTVSVTAATADKNGTLLQTLFDQFTSLLERANYNELSQDDINEALNEAGDLGFHLVIDFDIFEQLKIYARGESQETYQRRKWYRLFLKSTVTALVYQRLIVIFRLRQHPRSPAGADTKTVYIKVFKNIPKADLDTLLPGSRVKMTLFDRGKVALPTATGIGMTIYKVVTGAVLLVGNVYAALAAIGGLIIYGVKSFMGYLRTKEKHQSNLTKNLYFKNLDNNAGVLFRLLDEAEEQEFREAALAYYLLWKKAPPEGWTMQELDNVAEEYLRSQFNIDADFEVDDAVAKLVRFRMVQSDPMERLSAVDINDALVRLDEEWDNFFQYNVGDGQASQVAGSQPESATTPAE